MDFWTFKTSKFFFQKRKYPIWAYANLKNADMKVQRSTDEQMDLWTFKTSKFFFQKRKYPNLGLCKPRKC